MTWTKVMNLPDNNPLEDIENKKGQFDMGVTAIRTYQGALSEANNQWEAFFATCAFFYGMFRANTNPPDEDDNGAN